MAIAATAIWECRTTGNDANGGAFDPKVAAPGTDFSQQNAAQIAFTDLVIGNPTTTQLTSALHPFGSTSPGNFIHITGGTGFVPGWYEILSVSGTTATMDRAVGTAGSTGGTGNLGGAMATPGKTSSLMVSGNVMYLKNTGSVYTITSTSAGVSSGLVIIPAATTAIAPTMMVGYNTTRTIVNTDVGPTIQVGIAGVSSQSAVIQTQAFNVCRNILITNPSAFANWYGVQTLAGPVLVERMQISSVGIGIQVSASLGSSGQTDINLFSCYCFACTAVGYQIQQAGIRVVECTADECGTLGNSYAGFQIQANQCMFVQCLAINNNGPGFDQNSSNVSGGVFIACNAYNNAGVVGHGFVTGTGIMILVNCNSFGNQGNDIRDNLDTVPNYFNRLIGCACQVYTSASFSVNTNIVTGPSVGTLGIGALSGSPWNNPGGKDFSLNLVQGQKCRSQGFPRNFPGIPTSSFWDIGVAQHSVP